MKKLNRIAKELSQRKTILSKVTSKNSCIIYILILFCIIIMVQTTMVYYEKLIVFRWVKGKGLQISIENSVKYPSNNFDDNCSITKEMLVIISSSPSNFAQRDVIRKTWGNEKFLAPRSIKIYFSMGTQTKYLDNLKNEAFNHNDLILFNYSDLDTNNTFKSLHLLNYVFNNSYDYIVITSQDVYLNLPKLYDFLPKCPVGLMMGNLIIDEPKIYKICVNFTCQILNYTEHLRETTYVASLDVIKKFYKTTKIYNDGSLIKNDFITGFLPTITNVTLVNHHMFTYMENVIDPCILESVIVSHKLTPEKIIEAHANIIGLQYNQQICEGTIVFGSKINANDSSLLPPIFDKKISLGPRNPFGPHIIIN
ncbi:lactosylceramide 1,3-N-acetyl-beta-D-glucosaminyltransferase A-like [Onthophagus taurus]|uniref:lactosylceramide 1,3-N-acetyl-beta-D-glucosaminyltransferase A-like n=1 Tax=Onthophagus taurus TaxID=166361 RepID=UPI0039BE57B9